MKLLDRLSRREKGWLALAAIVLLVIGINHLVLIPVNQEKRAMDQQIQAMRQQLIELTRTAERAPYVKQQFQQDWAPLTTGRSDEEVTSRLLGTVEEIAFGAGVAVIATRVVEPGTARGEGEAGEQWYRLFSMELTGHCTPESMVHFLHRLNTRDGSYRVAVLDVAPRERGADQVRFTARITQLAGSEQTSPAL